MPQHFPLTTEIPIISILFDFSAAITATPLSIPGSTSKMTLGCNITNLLQTVIYLTIKIVLSSKQVFLEAHLVLKKTSLSVLNTHNAKLTTILDYGL